MDEKDYIMDEKREGGGKIPNQKELEKELSEYLSKKYGGRVKIVSPLVFPKTEESSGEGSGGGEEDEKRGFDLLPEELESYLDSYVVKQEQAKSVLSTKVCTHFNRIDHSKRTGGDKRGSGVGMIKNNVLMIGPTGVGKTYIIKLIAQKLGVPFVKGDATKFSETGYVGGDVEDLVRDLVYEAGDDIDLAETGIIYIDEVDKIASAQNIWGNDVSRSGVQRALLKPMEETDVDLKVAHDPISQIQAIEQYRKTGKKEKKVVNTRNILFIMSGAFGDLTEIIKNRLQRQGIGFEADVRPSEVPWDILKHVSAEDLIKFGFESEFVGRLPVVVVFDELTEDDLLEILKNPNNPIIISKRLDFGSYGIDIKFEEESLRKIARIAAAEKTGARGLVSAFERVLIPFEKALPSREVRQFLVTPEVVDDPEGELKKILADPQEAALGERFDQAKAREMDSIKSYLSSRAQELYKKTGLDLYDRRLHLIAELYLKNHYDTNSALDDFSEMVDQVRAEEAALSEKMEMNLTFEQGAIDEIIDQAIKTNQEAGSLTLQLGKRLEYGLKLVKDRSGIDSFTISPEAITEPESFINELIRKYYRDQYPTNYPGT